MEIDGARKLATALLVQHGLEDWRVVMDRAKTRAGICRFQTREIGLSGPLTALHSPAEVRDTILHEIAHALVGPLHKHDAVWRAQARLLGCSPRACLPPDTPRVAAHWLGTCPAGHLVRRHRRPAQPGSCSRCSPSYSPEHLLRWRHHGREVLIAEPRVIEEPRIMAAGRVRSAATWQLLGRDNGEPRREDRPRG